MSYILDALRRADAERERDPARGIHAQPAAGVTTRPRARVPAWAWPALGALLVGAAAAIGWQQRPQPVPTPPAVAPAPVAAPLPAPVVLPVATVVPAPAPAPAPRTAAAPAPTPPSAASPARRDPAAAAPIGTPLPAVAAAPAPSERIHNVAELPPDVRQGLPKLAISGAVYSDNADQRMLIVGGQVVSEGAELAPGVVLEQIRARSAVLRFRGWRYSVGF